MLLGTLVSICAVAGLLFLLLAVKRLRHRRFGGKRTRRLPAAAERRARFGTLGRFRFGLRGRFGFVAPARFRFGGFGQQG